MWSLYILLSMVRTCYRCKISINHAAEIRQNASLIERAVITTESRITSRVLRTLTTLRKRLSDEVLLQAIQQLGCVYNLRKFRSANNHISSQIQDSVNAIPLKRHASGFVISPNKRIWHFTWSWHIFVFAGAFATDWQAKSEQRKYWYRLRADFFNRLYRPSSWQ